MLNEKMFFKIFYMKIGTKKNNQSHWKCYLFEKIVCHFSKLIEQRIADDPLPECKWHTKSKGRPYKDKKPIKRATVRNENGKISLNKNKKQTKYPQFFYL